MVSEIRRQIRISVKLLLIFTLLTGLIYPILVTLCAQLLFPWKANGSLIRQDGHLQGSQLIGQAFKNPKYFWGRPSATAPFPYQSSASAGSNLGPSNPAFLTLVQSRAEALKKANPQAPESQRIPVDLVTASGSGLDPEISPRAAYYQVPRVAKARGQKEERIRALVDQLIQGRTFGILGEPRIKVLELNLALDRLNASQ